MFDIEEDPGETTDITEKLPELASYLQRTLQEWRERQLAYYHFPDYYTRFYPPKPPRWHSVEAALADLETTD